MQRESGSQPDALIIVPVGTGHRKPLTQHGLAVPSGNFHKERLSVTAAGQNRVRASHLYAMPLLDVRGVGEVGR